MPLRRCYRSLQDGNATDPVVRDMNFVTTQNSQGAPTQ